MRFKKTGRLQASVIYEKFGINKWNLGSEPSHCNYSRSLLLLFVVFLIEIALLIIFNLVE